VDMIGHFGMGICGCKEGNRNSHRVHRGRSAEDTEKTRRRKTRRAA
jgi:hypothetical protein